MWNADLQHPICNSSPVQVPIQFESSFITIETRIHYPLPTLPKNNPPALSNSILEPSASAMSPPTPSPNPTPPAQPFSTYTMYALLLLLPLSNDPPQPTINPHSTPHQPASSLTPQIAEPLTLRHHISSLLTLYPVTYPHIVPVTDTVTGTVANPLTAINTDDSIATDAIRFDHLPTATTKANPSSTGNPHRRRHSAHVRHLTLALS